MAYNILLLSRATSRYDAVCDIDHLTKDWCHDDPDYTFYWLPFERNGEMTRAELIEASVRPVSELTQEIVAAADHVLSYRDRKLEKYARDNPDFAPPIPSLQTLIDTYQPTWIGSMLIRTCDAQDEPYVPVNKYVFLGPGEQLFVMRGTATGNSDKAVYRYLVDECAMSADDTLTVSRIAGIKAEEDDHLTRVVNTRKTINPFKCIKCGSLNAERNPVEVEGQTLWEDIECADCKAEWTIFYRPSSVVYDPDGDAPQEVDIRSER